MRGGVYRIIELEREYKWMRGGGVQNNRVRERV